MKTPLDILDKFEKSAIGLDYGTVTLCLDIKMGRIRYIIHREESCVPNVNLEPGSENTCRQIPDKGKPQIYQYIMGLTY